MTALSGAFPALVTPLTSDGEVHEDDLATLIGRVLSEGASGVLVAGRPARVRCSNRPNANR